MKLRREDKVVVIAGRDKGKTGTVLRVLPKENQVVIENVNVAKRHTKPSQKQPRGGILEITKPIAVAKVMVLDPQSGKPARIGFEVKPDGSKERIFKVSPNHEKTQKKAEKAPKPAKTEKPAPAKSAAAKTEPKTEPKAGKK